MKRGGDPRQVSLLPPDAAALLHLVRENLRILGELAGRYEVPLLDVTAEQQVIHSPADVAAYLGPEMAELAQEQVRVVLLNTKHRVIGVQLVYQGGVNATTVRIADCFREAVKQGAPAIVLVHNHPSGDPTPSAEDIHLTQDIARAGELLGIEILDHIVIGKPDYVSLRERGLFAPSAKPAP